ncbi:MAG TPA: hypothetical protein VKE40_14300 [Gemmataceae bacterium]|nr:hypothetical protein [Gemmataceae bacterium]
MTRAACGLALALASLAAAPAPLVVSRNTGDPAKKLVARAELDADEVRLSGELTLTLTVEGPAPLEVTPPKPLLDREKGGLWRAREDGLPVREVFDDGRQRWRQTYRLSPLVPGKDVVVKLGPLSVRAGGEQDTRIEWPGESRVKVVTTIEAPSPDSLRPATDVELLPPPPPVDRGPSPWRFAIVPALLLAAIGALALGRRKRRAKAPRDAAWAQGELASGQLTADRCATVLRQYLAFRFSVPAEARTTPELVAALQADGRLPADALTEWRALLDECDAARFSGTVASVAGLADRARALVESAEAAIEAAATPTPAVPADHES